MKEVTRLEAYKAIAEGKTVRLEYIASDGNSSFLLFHPMLVTGGLGETKAKNEGERWYIIPNPFEKIKTNQEYLAEPTRCPVCNSSNLFGEGFESEGKEAYQPISCGNCGATWDDYYSLTSFGDLRNAQGDEFEVIYD